MSIPCAARGAGTPNDSPIFRYGMEEDERTSRGPATSISWKGISRTPNWMGAIVVVE